ncbi:MAG: hypothetical protein M3O30_17595 [Planctomycetota bacterium]|nr:hypothetical protein [Planctomycetota bacterium]
MNLSYEGYCRRFGFRVPKSYFQLMEIANRLQPDHPWNAFDPIGLLNLDDCGPEACSYTAPGDFVVLGWTGGDSIHYGFVLDDDINSGCAERAIAMNDPIGTDTRLLANSLPEFLGFLCANDIMQAYGDVSEKCFSEANAVAEVLQAEFGFKIPKTQLAAEKSARRERLRRGATPTEDRIGVMLPAETVDLRTIDRMARRIAGVNSWESSGPDERLLDEAEQRLSQGEIGTALVIARNFRFHYWYSDWEGSRSFIRRTSDILGRAYVALGRDYAAQALVKQTEGALKNVT